MAARLRQRGAARLPAPYRARPGDYLAGRRTSVRVTLYVLPRGGVTVSRRLIARRPLRRSVLRAALLA